MGTDVNKIVVIGSMNTDMVITSERIPLPGETVLGGKFMMNSGGKGANQAVAAARLGGNVYFIARAGNDVFGHKAIAQYREDGINTDHIFCDNELPSGVALILVDAKGENCISVASGANAALSPENIDDARNLISECSIVLMQLETPIDTVEHAAKIAHGYGKTVILNPAPACRLPEGLLKNVDIIIPNETEAGLLAGIEVNNSDDARRAADIISGLGVNIVIITLGSHGALIKEGDRYEIVAARRVKAVDTTAAGDTFCGAFAVALSEGKCVREAVDFATRCAAVTVTRPGAQLSIPRRAEVEE